MADFNADRRIDASRKGQPILTASEHDPEGPRYLSEVGEFFQNGLKHVINLYVEGRLFRPTPNHKIYTRGRGFVPAGELQPGDELLTSDHRWVKVSSIVDKGEVVPVFNVMVPKGHTYFVGSNQRDGFSILVHNDSEGDPRYEAGAAPAPPSTEKYGPPAPTPAPSPDEAAARAEQRQRDEKAAVLAELHQMWRTIVRWYTGPADPMVDAAAKEIDPRRLLQLEKQLPNLLTKEELDTYERARAGYVGALNREAASRERMKNGPQLDVPYEPYRGTFMENFARPGGYMEQGLGALAGLSGGAPVPAMRPGSPSARGASVRATPAELLNRRTPSTYTPAPGASPRGRQVKANKAAGDAWEHELINNELPKTQSEIQPQITIKSNGPSGKKVRLDAVGKDNATGATKLSDGKASDTAGLTPNQTVVYPELETHGGTVVGKGKPPYVGGTSIPPTKVDILRPGKP